MMVAYALLFWLGLIVSAPKAFFVVWGITMFLEVLLFGIKMYLKGAKQ